MGYFFGRKIHLDTKVPIGLLGTNWGGTRIEPWTPPIGFQQVPQLKDLANLTASDDPRSREGKVRWGAFLKRVQAWTEQVQKAIDNGTALPKQPESPGSTNASHPTSIYNAMVHGLAPYGVRGAIWYQGESNGNEGVEYFHKMQALIGGWRALWDQGDFPFYFYHVQLANWQQPTDDPAGGNGWARLREAQRQSLTISHTGMAVIIDIGEANDIHPRNKQDVGARLARWALRDVAKQDLVVSGPLFREVKQEDGRLRVLFDHTGDGLMIGKKQGLDPTKLDASGSLKRIAVAGKDRKWHWADTKIDGNSLVVWSDDVEQPVAVRYAYSMNPEGANLYNKEGLPASPFRSDDW